MASLLEMLKSTISRTAQTDAEIYRSIVARHESPKPGDDAELHRVMTALGLTFDDVAQDCSAWSEYQRLEATAASLEDARVLAKTTAPKITEWMKRREAAMAALDQEGRDLEGEKSRLQTSMVKCNNAAVRRREIARQFVRLFPPIAE
jgi:hypothetical protein